MYVGTETIKILLYRELAVDYVAKSGLIEPKQKGVFMAEKNRSADMIVWLYILAFLFGCVSIFLHSIQMLLSGICFALIAIIIETDYDDL